MSDIVPLIILLSLLLEVFSRKVRNLYREIINYFFLFLSLGLASSTIHHSLTLFSLLLDLLEKVKFYSEYTMQ